MIHGALCDVGLLSGNVASVENLSADISSEHTLCSEIVLPSVTIDKDYEKLDNKPRINDVVLIGNRISSELGLQDEMTSITNSEIEELLN